MQQGLRLGSWQQHPTPLHALMQAHAGAYLQCCCNDCIRVVGLTQLSQQVVGGNALETQYRGPGHTVQPLNAQLSLGWVTSQVTQACQAAQAARAASNTHLVADNMAS
jgi:hypothetical protein